MPPEERARWRQASGRTRLVSANNCARLDGTAIEEHHKTIMMGREAVLVAVWPILVFLNDFAPEDIAGYGPAAQIPSPMDCILHLFLYSMIDPGREEVPSLW